MSRERLSTPKTLKPEPPWFAANCLFSSRHQRKDEASQRLPSRCSLRRSVGPSFQATISSSKRAFRPRLSSSAETRRSSTPALYRQGPEQPLLWSAGELRWQPSTHLSFGTPNLLCLFPRRAARTGASPFLIPKVFLKSAL
jgi:hypothetical protein